MIVLDKPEYFGQLLHQRGFRDWFIYMFNLIKDRKFVVEALHEKMFVEYQSLYKMQQKRLNVNVPPRSAKTTFNIFFIAYTLAGCTDAEFIYTSFSQDLLGDISRQLQTILNHKSYRAMYSLDNSAIEQVSEKPINDFWRNYLDETQGKEQFSNRKIITSAGGIVYFASMGSNITGFGAGKRNSVVFSGCLLIDDGNKPAEIRSEVIRERVHRYYDETLLSRLNDSSTAIINVQQRLHQEDLSGYLSMKYKFNTFMMPLVNSENICCLPSQYTAERIRELQVNAYLWLSQYQQEPIKLGGNVIKSKWFNYYNNINELKFKHLFFVGDTAQKTKEHNDFSVIGAFGVDEANLYLIDLIRGKWESPELRKKVISFWEKWQNGINGKNFNAMYIEDKASGTGLIQDLRRNSRIPIIGEQRNIDKVTRVDDALPYLEAGKFYLPVDENYSFNPDIIKECEAFSRDLTHKHDDIVDVITDAINIGLVKMNYDFNIVVGVF